MSTEPSPGTVCSPILLTPTENAALAIAGRSGRRDIPAPASVKDALRALAARVAAERFVTRATDQAETIHG